MNLNNNKNFSIEYNTRLGGFFGGEKQYIASIDGKIKTNHNSCQNCNQANYVNNGYHSVEAAFIRECGLAIKISQFLCKKCNCYWSSNRELIDKVIQTCKGFVKSILLNCVRAGLSFEKSTKLLESTIGKTYSPQYIYELYVSALEQVKVEKFASASGIYYYDEQFLKVNGIEVCRLVIKDRMTNKVIADTQTPDAKKETIKGVMETALEGLPVEVFIVDLDTRYPEIIWESFPKAKIQWCIFHLDKLIWKELWDEFGKNLSLVELYNAYTLFNIFFDHMPELEKLKELLNTYDKIRTNDLKSNSLIEKSLRKEFGTFVKTLKRERRRNKRLVPRRTQEESKKIFTQIKQQKQLYSKKLQKRITKIDENWDRFTLFQRDARIEPTNNGVEHYFAATLAKTDKKDFRSTGAVDRELRAFQAEWNGKKLFSGTKLVDVMNMMGMLFLAFPPT